MCPKSQEDLPRIVETEEKFSVLNCLILSVAMLVNVGIPLQCTYPVRHLKSMTDLPGAELMLEYD